MCCSEKQTQDARLTAITVQGSIVLVMQLKRQQLGMSSAILYFHEPHPFLDIQVSLVSFWDLASVLRLSGILWGGCLSPTAQSGTIYSFHAVRRAAAPQ